jgi:tetratricopeptide (TPR) repeat protein
MGDSIFRKIAKILEKPEEPAYLRERRQQATIPWYRSMLDSLRPPSSAPSARRSLSPTQRRMVLISLATIPAIAAVWSIYGYIASASDRSRSAYEAGLKMLGPGDFKGAAREFSDSISISETPAAYIERGNVYRTLGQPDKALADWKRAIELDPNSATAYAARGTHYRIVGNNAAAMSDLNRSIQIVPNVDGFYQRGQVYAALGKFDDAMKDYNQAIELGRGIPFLYMARASARRALGDPEGSLEDQATAMRLQSGQ